MQTNTKTRTRQILIIAATILLVRLIFVDAYHSLQGNFGYHIYDFIVQIISDYMILVPSLIFNILFVIRLNHHLPYGVKPIKRVLLIIGYILFVTLIVACVINIDTITSSPREHLGEIIFSLFASLIYNTTTVILTDVFSYLSTSKLRLIDESNKKRKAQYQYSQLKQQLNPHFLFNSLNILDYLVQNGEQARASEFIRKLAGVYRYLLQKENNKLVPLEDELKFVRMYIDLMKERFTDGLIVSIDVPAYMLECKIVPCGLQTMVENATKHNIVSIEKPLYINITTEQEKIVVSNNIQLKIRTDESTGVGLSNINAQYCDIAGVNIEIKEINNEFVVKLPIL